MKLTMSAHQCNLSKGNILIVDDCPENLNLLAIALIKYGYTTQLASSGSLALQMVELSPPDLIVLDVMMPHMDGYEVCQALKAQESSQNIPIIFVSALKEAKYKVQAFSVGASDFVTKPLKVTEVVARIDHQLQLVRLQQKLNQQTEQLLQQNQQLQQEIHERKCLEESLKASDNQLRGLFAAIQDVVLVLDDAGNYLKVAPTNSAHLLYKPAEDLQGKTLHEMLPKQNADAFLQQIRKALSTQKAVDYEYSLVIHERTVWFGAKISPISQKLVIWVARDITERKLFELEILEKSQSLATFSSSLKQLHRLKMQDFKTFETLFANYIQTGCCILGFSAGAVGQVSDQTYTFLAVQSPFEELVPDLKVNLKDTFCSKVVEGQQTVGFQNIKDNAEMRRYPIYQTLKLESYLGTPIFDHEELFGTLCFFSTQPRPQGFEQHEREIIELMAQSLGKYISAYQTDIQRQQAEEEVQLLLNLTQAIAAAPDFNQALEIALQSLCEATGWNYGEVWLPSADGRTLECSPIWHHRVDGEDAVAIAAVEQFRCRLVGATCQPGEGIAGGIWSRQQAEWMPDIHDQMMTPPPPGDFQNEQQQAAVAAGFNAYFGVPVGVVRDRRFESAFSVPIDNGTSSTLLAVLLFFTKASRPQDQRFTALVAAMAAQLGTVLLQKQVEAELNALLIAMSDVIVVRDAQGLCLKLVPNNPLLYASAADMVGKTLHETLPLPIAELILAGIERSLETWQTVDVEYSLVLGKKEVCFLARVSPLSSESVIIVARDITQRKQVEAALQDSEERFRTIFEQAAVGIVVMDTAGQFIRVNQRLCSILGYTEFELLGMSLQDTVYPEDLERSQSYVQQVLAGTHPSDSLEIRCACKKRPMGWVNLTLSRLGQTADRSACLIAVVEDIQERKQIEADLQQAKEAAIREATQNADANRTKSEFLASISHELRTPLNAILGFTQLIARESCLNDKTRDYLAIISRSGEHLLNLINDVLEMSKIEAGRTSLKLSSFDLHYFLQELEAMLRLNAEAKGLQFIFDYAPEVPQYVEADEGKLRQVLINLLGNAIKFTVTGGVALRVNVGKWGHEGVTNCIQDYGDGLQQEGDFAEIGIDCDGSADANAHRSIHPSSSVLFHPITLCFEVEDTGIGIAPADLESLFDPFVQSKSRNASSEGTGLGLPISQKFVQLMGGTIAVTSTPGRGTLCQFDIQIVPSQVVEPSPRPCWQQAIALVPGQRPHRILVVDDHTASRQLLVNLLQTIGFDVQEAINGQEAIEHWQRWRPHLIWMDMRMPLIDGYEATRRIRAVEAEDIQAHPQATKIIAVTASAFEEDRARVLDAGCDDFVRKPFRESVILKKMAVHLGIRYIYAQPNDMPPAPHLQAAPPMEPLTLQFMPTEWIQQVHYAAIRGSDEQLLRLLEQIPESHAPLVNTLTTWVLEYQFDRLLNLTQGTAQ